MLKFKPIQAIWFLCLLIILQVIWIDFRLNKLINLSSDLLSQQEKQIEANLRQVAEPEINQEVAKGASLSFRPDKAEFSQDFSLDIWVKTTEPIKQADLKIFYPNKILKLTSDNWQTDESVGIASWSAKLTPAKQGEFLLTQIPFQLLSPGEAKIDFDFIKESKLDCNVINIENKDVLEAVNNGEYKISFK